MVVSYRAVGGNHKNREDSQGKGGLLLKKEDARCRQAIPAGNAGACNNLPGGEPEPEPRAEVVQSHATVYVRMHGLAGGDVDEFVGVAGVGNSAGLLAEKGLLGAAA